MDNGTKKAKKEERYLILGPEDQDHLPMFWGRHPLWGWGWVERERAILYDDDIWLFPPWELPVGKGVCIMDIVVNQKYTPRSHRKKREDF